MNYQYITGSNHGGSESVLETTTKAAAEPQIATASRSNSVTTAAPAKPATSEPAQATRPITAAAQATEAEMASTTVAVPLQSLAEKRKETTGISNYRAKPTDTTTTDPPLTETVPIKESKAATARRNLSAPPPHPLPLPPPPPPLSATAGGINSRSRPLTSRAQPVEGAWAAHSLRDPAVELPRRRWMQVNGGRPRLTAATAAAPGALPEYPRLLRPGAHLPQPDTARAALFANSIAFTTKVPERHVLTQYTLRVVDGPVASHAGELDVCRRGAASGQERKDSSAGGQEVRGDTRSERCEPGSVVRSSRDRFGDVKPGKKETQRLAYCFS
ncbi:uncharacterized protein LOC126482076 [Schistocerca serialis cubense]|uniref:uncharacterized protein LOC126482076 n=1 Tax=Schistocerca serialis cubense TaxID=2023355 RepID=UPI00214E1025|nr:uncharacterized protein LOC126482076 [Schistocerca serialis cubense]